MKKFPEHWSALHVTLSHDWLTGMRGGERVLELLCEGFPRATIYTLIHKPERISRAINAHPIYTSILQHMPGIFRTYRYYLPVYPLIMERKRIPPASLLLSTSHCIAKGIAPPPGTRHLCYCFTPMRYAWTFYDEYFGANPLKKAALGPILAGMRKWDMRTSERVHRFVAISRHVQDRIHRFYGRESDIVYPPVDTERCVPGAPGDDGYDLIVSALVPYKRVDLAVEAYNRTGRPLRIVGVGTEHDRLRRKAADHIEFLGWQTDEKVLELYQRCRFLIFPGEEDFGIVPVEAQACGKPVIAFARGGAMETVVDGETGIFFHEQKVDALLNAVETAAAKKWEPGTIRRNAEKFGIQPFLNGLDQSIRKCLGLSELSGTGSAATFSL